MNHVPFDSSGIFDPTPICDGANAIISIAQGNWKDAAYSAVAMVPYIGDVIGKGGKARVYPQFS